MGDLSMKEREAPTPDHLRRMAAVLDQTSGVFRADADQLRALATRIETREIQELRHD